MNLAALRVSPQQIDPLSWYAKPLMPFALAGMVIIFGFDLLASTWQLGTRRWIDLLAIALIVGACILVYAWTRPLHPKLSSPRGAAVLVLALAGLILSTVSGIDSVILVQHWWAPIGVAFVVATLGPHSTVLQTLHYGAMMTIASAACGVIAFGDTSAPWTPFGVAIVSASAVAVATTATALFSYVIVSTTQSLLAGAGTEPAAAASPCDEPSDEASEEASEEVARRVERRTLARLGARVAPFLKGIADAGEVTAADRALAGQLARQLRSDLVGQVNRSWLDSIALFERIYVVDPDFRANNMNGAQRTALRALLMAVLTNPAATVGSLSIELRGQADGSTAVALSLDFSLPEGRRNLMLAPYYLTLQTTVESLSWDPERDLMKFKVPAQSD